MAWDLSDIAQADQQRPAVVCVLRALCFHSQDRLDADNQPSAELQLVEVLEGEEGDVTTAEPDAPIGGELLAAQLGVATE